MSLLNNYSEITEKDIRKMSHEELIQAVLRLLKTKQKDYSKTWGKMYIGDDLVNNFRNKN